MKQISCLFYLIFLLSISLLFGYTDKSEKKSEVSGVVQKSNGSKKAYNDDFFQVTRFIMTEEEIDIFKHLVGPKARAEFVEEFWKKRDPSPETEENENREEYEDRINYANKWFKEHSRNRGWDTERGRLLLQLGFPDKREWGEAKDIVRSGRPRYIGAMVTSKPIPMEKWTYYDYRMVLVFADAYEKGRMELTNVPTELPYALEKAKFGLDLRDKNNMKNAFRFSVQYINNEIEISVPSKKISFLEENENMIAEFDVHIYVYKNKLKIDEINIQKNVSMEKEKLLVQKNIKFLIPYMVSEKGRYSFDIIIVEKGSDSKFRDFCDFKLIP